MIDSRLRWWLFAAVGTAAIAVGAGGAQAAGRWVPARGGAAAGHDGLVFASDRGQGGWFAMDADGSNVRALKAPLGTASEVAWSPDASHVAYTAKEFGPLIVMRADGTQRVQVAKTDVSSNVDLDVAWSPDGTLLAYELVYDYNRVHCARSDGTPAGTLALPRSSGFEGWVGNDRVSLITSGDKWVADRVGGGHRVNLPDVGDHYAWSPSGKQLAYESESRNNALCFSNADGSGRRCPSPSLDVVDLAWSPHGDRLALAGPPDLSIVDPQTLRARVVAKVEPYADDLVWSSDATQIAFSVHSDIGVVRVDGSKLKVIVSPGGDRSPRWVPAARLARFEGAKVAPIGPAFLPSARALEVHGAVDELAADGDRAAVLTSGTPDHSQHVVIWKPGAKGLRHFFPDVGTLYGLAFAGGVAAWIEENWGNFGYQSISTSARNVVLETEGDQISRDQGGKGDYIGNLVGNDGVLAWNQWSQKSDTAPAENASLTAWRQGRQRVVLRGPDSIRVVAADGTHLLVLKPDGSLVVVGVDGKIVRRFPARAGVRGASLNGNDVAVVAGGKLTNLDLATGKVKRTWNVPPTAKSVDVQDGVAAYAAGKAITLIDLRRDKSTSLPLKTTRSALAQLEPAGLFYAYGTGGKSWVRLLPFTDIRKRLSR